MEYDETGYVWLELHCYDSYYCDDAYLGVNEASAFTWTLYGADSVNTIKNAYISEIVFSDGTKW